LIALLDDVASLSKAAAASIDDALTQSAKAGAKAAGVVVDDAAVTPRYVTGFSPGRELPIVGRIAIGSLKNKLLWLLPAALLLSLLAPWMITPLLMLGGAWLCYEGAEKVFSALWPHAAREHEKATGVAGEDPKQVEDRKVAAAVSTDFVLSAEIMAITLASVPALNLWEQAVVLAIVGIGVTVAVYGVVALIVKADDAGVALLANPWPRMLRPLARGVGRALVKGMPVLMRVLSVVGTAAMLWVGGGIILHGLEAHGIGGPAHWVHHVAEAVAHAVPGIEAAAEWIASAAVSGVLGLMLGAMLIPLAHYLLGPLLALMSGHARTAEQAAPP
jgi:predicted DNA repair protein MutK